MKDWQQAEEKQKLEHTGGSLLLTGFRTLWILGEITYSFLLPQLFCRNIRNVGLRKLSLGLLLCLAIFLFLFFLSGSWRLAASLELVSCLILANLNQFVYQYRGTGISIYDLLAWRTAYNVAGGYHLRWNAWWALLWLLAAIWLAGTWLSLLFLTGKSAHSPSPHNHRKGRKALLHFRLPSLLLSLLLLILLFCASAGMTPDFWANQGATRNGYFLNLFLELKESGLKEPEGYSEKALAQLVAEYEEKARQRKGKVRAPEQKAKPSILVVMDESFADLRHLGPGLETNLPVLPFLDVLRGEDPALSPPVKTGQMLSGYTLSPVFGGSTANSEYEFLTGNTCAFLPQGSIPYHQYVRKPEDSLVSLLHRDGYRCISMHPYLASGWNRPAVYEAMGFAESYFLDAFPREDLIRGYVSDRECFGQMLSALDACSKEDQPLFLFAVTMQNHGEYRAIEDFGEISLEAPGEAEAEDVAETELYLNLVHETDSALEDFLKELSEREEPVVVLFFGDHEPALSENMRAALHGGPFTTLDEEELCYEVPFFLWTNQEADSSIGGLAQPGRLEADGIHTGMNFLSGMLLDFAGVEKDAYHVFLEEFSAVIPQMNPYGFYSLESACMKPYEEASPVEKEWLERYEMWNIARIRK